MFCYACVGLWRRRRECWCMRSWSADIQEHATHSSLHVAENSQDQIQRKSLPHRRSTWCTQLILSLNSLRLSFMIQCSIKY